MRTAQTGVGYWGPNLLGNSVVNEVDQISVLAGDKN